VLVALGLAVTHGLTKPPTPHQQMLLMALLLKGAEPIPPQQQALAGFDLLV
jgi:hypothetical protein